MDTLTLFDMGPEHLSLNVDRWQFIMRAEQVYHMHGCALVRCDHIQGEIWGDRWECPLCGCHRMVGSPEIIAEGA